MKKPVLFISFLFAALFVQNTFSQSQDGELTTESIKLEETKISGEDNQNCGFDRKTIFIIKVIKPLFSTNSKIEVDLRNKILTVTDSEKRVKFIIKLIKLLSTAELPIEETLAKDINEKYLTETVANYILPALHCDVGEELSYNLRRLKQDLLIETVKKLNVQVSTVKMEMFVYGLELKGTQKQVELAKNIIILFNESDLS